MKNWNEYFKLNEEILTQVGDNEWQEEDEEEDYADRLGLNGCKIIGACDIDGGIKLKLRDGSSELCYVNITIKNGKVNLYKNYEYDNDDSDDEN